MGARLRALFEVVGVDDVNDIRRGLCLLQRGDGLLRQDLARILQVAGGAHDVALRHCDRDLVVAVAHVELAVAAMAIGDPAVHVVVHRELRIPVAEVVDVLVLVAHARGGASYRNGERIVDLDREALPARQRFGQVQREPRVPRAGADDLAADAHFAEFEAVGRHDGARAFGVGLHQVLIEMQDQLLLLVRRAIVIGELGLAGEARGHRIEFDR